MQVQNVHWSWATGKHWQNDKHSMEQPKLGRSTVPDKMCKSTMELKKKREKEGLDIYYKHQ